MEAAADQQPGAASDKFQLWSKEPYAQWIKKVAKLQTEGGKKPDEVAHRIGTLSSTRLGAIIYVSRNYLALSGNQNPIKSAQAHAS